MNNKKHIQQLREQCAGVKELPDETLAWITQQNLWNLWVPKKYGGLEHGLTDGLRKLKSLAAIDGSLGWTVTLCSGANYFIGNLKKEVAEELFSGSINPVLGGSGGAFGTAEKQGDSYQISGKWHYATGAPYLTHFTLNARITEGGNELKTDEGEPVIRSFVLPREKVAIIDDWNTMGLLPTATYSFKVDAVEVPEKYSFHYSQIYLSQPIYQIPFSLFADLTLWVNYIGMARHYREVAQHVLNEDKLARLNEIIENTNEMLLESSRKVEQVIKKGENIDETYSQTIHRKAAESIRRMSTCLIELHPHLGIKASRLNESLNQIFRDYFTATQHRNFVD